MKKPKQIINNVVFLFYLVSSLSYIIILTYYYLLQNFIEPNSFYYHYVTIKTYWFTYFLCCTCVVLCVLYFKKIMYLRAYNCLLILFCIDIINSIIASDYDILLILSLVIFGIVGLLYLNLYFTYSTE